MFLLSFQKSKYIHATNCQLGRQQKQCWNLLWHLRLCQGPYDNCGGGEERRGTPSHSQVTCDLRCQVQCDLRLWDDMEKTAVATRIKGPHKVQNSLSEAPRKLVESMPRSLEDIIGREGNKHQVLPRGAKLPMSPFKAQNCFNHKLV
jgi:hypothetical protein